MNIPQLMPIGISLAYALFVGSAFAEAVGPDQPLNQNAARHDNEEYKSREGQQFALGPIVKLTVRPDGRLAQAASDPQCAGCPSRQTCLCVPCGEMVILGGKSAPGELGVVKPAPAPGAFAAGEQKPAPAPGAPEAAPDEQGSGEASASTGRRVSPSARGHSPRTSREIDHPGNEPKDLAEQSCI
jgi:hypothetical protein